MSLRAKVLLVSIGLFSLVVFSILLLHIKVDHAYASVSPAYSDNCVIEASGSIKQWQKVAVMVDTRTDTVIDCLVQPLDLQDIQVWIDYQQKLQPRFNPIPKDVLYTSKWLSV